VDMRTAQVPIVPWQLLLGFILFGFMNSPTLALARVGLYDLWEIRLVNSRSYANPFDFTIIELQATFTAPSGRQVKFFGFYDGDGHGGQTGNVWKLRFMPDELGSWHYVYSWTDETAGGSGTFEVVDIGRPGPLQIAADNPLVLYDRPWGAVSCPSLWDARLWAKDRHLELGEYST
jgi:hypothetical protein